jgi:hypothetical protein
MVQALAVRGDLEGAQALVLVGQGHVALLVTPYAAQGSTRQVEVVRKIERGG